MQLLENKSYASLFEHPSAHIEGYDENHTCDSHKECENFERFIQFFPLVVFVIQEAIRTNAASAGFASVMCGGWDDWKSGNGREWQCFI
jgi:hypothetical protein